MATAKNHGTPSPDVLRAVDRLIEVAGHTEVVKHEPGRIELRIKPKGVLLALNLNLADLLDLRLSIRGLLGAKADLGARSLVIHYDPKILPKEVWELLVRANASPKLQNLVRRELVSRLTEEDLGTIRQVSDRLGTL
ncbi:MAG: hypothetical protein HY900_30840 [Deltaproteobacteria bacterium]|nr:hypothetical protein [Deltaproteobacteria bacterium]